MLVEGVPNASLERDLLYLEADQRNALNTMILPPHLPNMYVERHYNLGEYADVIPCMPCMPCMLVGRLN